ncbi:unnamed protein product [Peniophora sp. CBMAI 1063]|nr:unnamed protein product [Peniophora sp. CBMAI 1063]
MTVPRVVARCIGAGVFVVVTLAIAVALDLAFGLRHYAYSALSLPGTLHAVPDYLRRQLESNFRLSTAVSGEAPRTREYHFTVGHVVGAPDGVERDMLVVNGMYPGPTIEANQGDRLLVTVQNNLDERTSIHWHGLYQNSTPWYDGTLGITECGILPGQSLTYNFTLGEFYGTTWWHAHPYGYSSTDLKSDIAGTQYSDGVVGALIVHPTQDVVGWPAWDEDLLVQMADWYHDFSTNLLELFMRPDIGLTGTPGDEPVPDSSTINGLGQWQGHGDYFTFNLERGKTYRLRLLNTGSFASIKFSIDSHQLTVIEADSTPITPFTARYVTVAVAQRYSVLVKADAPRADSGAYWMRSTMMTDMFRYSKWGINTDVRGIVRYKGESDEGMLPGPADSPDPWMEDKSLPLVDGLSTLEPLVEVPIPDATRAWRVQYSFQKTWAHEWLGFMNMTSWLPVEGRASLFNVQEDATYTPQGTSTRGDEFYITEDGVYVVDIQISSLDDGDHPFHIHGYTPWIMAVGSGRYIGQEYNIKKPLRRDTFFIPAYHYMVIRIVTDNPGLWAFHCHIQWHMAQGLLMQIAIQPSKLAQWTAPPELLAQCGDSYVPRTLDTASEDIDTSSL